MGILARFVWWLFIQGPLVIIKGFENTIEYITSDLIFDFAFGGKSVKIGTMPLPFFIVSMLSLVTLLLIFVYQMTIDFPKTAAIGVSNRMLKSLKYSVGAIIFIVAMPTFFYGLCYGFSWFQKTLLNALGSNNLSIAEILYKVGDTNFSGNFSNLIVPSDFNAPSNIRDYNMFAQFMATFSMLIVLIFLGMIIVKSFITVTFWFFVSPFFAVSQVADEGVKFNIWKNNLMVQLWICLGVLLALNIFVISLTVLILASANFSGASKTIFLIISIVGGGFMTLEVPSHIGSFFGIEIKTPNNWIKRKVKSVGSNWKQKRMAKKGLSNNSKQNSLKNNSSKNSFSPPKKFNRTRVAVDSLASTGMFGSVNQRRGLNQLNQVGFIKRHNKRKLNKHLNINNAINQVGNQQLNKLKGRQFNKTMNKLSQSNKKIKKYESRLK